MVIMEYITIRTLTSLINDPTFEISILEESNTVKGWDTVLTNSQFRITEWAGCPFSHPHYQTCFQ